MSSELSRVSDLENEELARVEEVTMGVAAMTYAGQFHMG